MSCAICGPAGSRSSGQEVDLRSGTTDNALVLFKLHAGTEVRVVDRREQALRSALPEKGRGDWIEAQHAEVAVEWRVENKPCMWSLASTAPGLPLTGRLDQRAAGEVERAGGAEVGELPAETGRLPEQPALQGAQGRVKHP